LTLQASFFNLKGYRYMKAIAKLIKKSKAEVSDSNTYPSAVKTLKHAFL